MKDKSSFTPLHGGNLIAASEHYGIPVEQWIDLSTGMNPEPYPVGDIPLSVFTELPYLKPEFLSAAATYYGSDNFVAVSGSQSAIQALPLLLPTLPVLLPSVGYQEHAKSWQTTHQTHFYPSLTIEEQTGFIETSLAENSSQHLVVINPNNPTGVKLSPEVLLAWASRLTNGGCLIVDEAFMDLTPDHSLLNRAIPENVIVLRSFGKFFGLAGIRLGFVFASQELRAQLEQTLGLWQVNGPAQYIASQALVDVEWQHRACEQIAQMQVHTQNALMPLYDAYQPIVLNDSGLFISWLMKTELAVLLADKLAQQGILIRRIECSDDQSILRFGLLTQDQTIAVAIHCYDDPVL
ncbi:threonine-phosphate decarboxylase [Litoribrevibacter albus]|uniref:Aminotransferase n=1 Tax=Litoribrevibacter albus TaxID=1473156 RepID=A0AA37W6K3_9GAMM|nr:threonine-phosphate decarboxylase [Litoribrevibacter albus]GLQ29999.1 threonine-phosphate decarboxylase [Litoribrevibacter albus]